MLAQQVYDWQHAKAVREMAEVNALIESYGE